MPRVQRQLTQGSERAQFSGQGLLQRITSDLGANGQANVPDGFFEKATPVATPRVAQGITFAGW